MIIKMIMTIKMMMIMMIIIMMMMTMMNTMMTMTTTMMMIPPIGDLQFSFNIKDVTMTTMMLHGFISYICTANNRGSRQHLVSDSPLTDQHSIMYITHWEIYSVQKMLLKLTGIIFDNLS